MSNWCDNPLTAQRKLELPAGILSVLLDDEITSEDKFIACVKDKLNDNPKYMDIDFNPPVFPFDNKYFEDPFFLVECADNELIDVEGIRAMKQNDLDDYLKQLYNRFTYMSEGKIKIKGKQLLEYAGRSYYFDTIKKKGDKSRFSLSAAKKKRMFITKSAKGLNNLHISATMQRSVIRKKAAQGAELKNIALIDKTDLLSYKRHFQERSNVLVAIDCSKSMQQDKKLEHAKKAAISFHYYKSSHSPQSKIEFVAFNDRITKVNPLELFSLKAQGMTHTAELLNFAFNYFNKANKERCEFYIITDGYPQHKGMDDRIYHASTLKIAERLKSFNLKLKVLLISTSPTTSNTANIAYNELICHTLKGELVHINPEDASCSLIG
ncbi:von Willebrand factor, type A domain protein [Candidatus Magnetoovum chiemensis]|nr:von Willebrand factor, type A domain protein [Candidatus Magnetoovum chiemensis]